MAPFFLHGESPRPVPQWRNPSPYAIGPADPHWANVVLYLPLTGTDGQATFTDVSQYGHAVTRNGDVAISTAQVPPLAGVTSSAYFDGNGDFLSVNSSNTFGDLTVEAFVYNAGGTDKAIYSSSGFSFVLGVAGKLRFYTGNGDNVVDGTSNYASATWLHVAASRQGGTLKFFINGTEGGSYPYNHSLGSTATPLIGRFYFSPAAFLSGHLSHLRVTGAGRYVTNFAPPTAPFPIG